MVLPPKRHHAWRFEIKYRISPAQYYAVKSAMLPYMEPDFYTRRSRGRYLVRSLYFDTNVYQAYEEKIAGDFRRIKLRLRSYSDAADGTPVRVELKTRRGPVMEKHRCFVEPSDCAHFLKEWHWPAPTDDPVLVEFERLVHLRVQRPKVLVEYRREGLRARSRDDLRITFDHNVRSAGATSIFPEHPFFRDHHRHQVIMEVKFRFDYPVWLTALVKRYGLKIVANSKYARAVEVAQPDVVVPAR